jgi:peptidyl-prolyl cis-trans isomerase SurA
VSRYFFRESLYMVRVVWCLCVLLLAVPFNGTAAELFDRIVAIVNDEIVTEKEFNRQLLLATLGTEQPGNLDRESRRQILEQMVDRKLLLQEAQRLNITVRDQDVDKALQDIIDRNNMTLREMQRQLESAGLMLEDVRASVRAELTTSELIGREVYARVSISDAEMEKYYRENIKPQEGHGARVRLKQILLQVGKENTPEQVGAVQERAESLRAQLEAGASFEQLAASYSQCPSADRGGDIGFFYKNQLLPAIEQAAFSMPLDTPSQVIKTPVGFHIIVVTFRDAGETAPDWKTHESDIRSALFGDAFERVYAKWHDDLRANAHIEIRY